MRKATLRCHCEIAGVEHATGDVVEVDEANFSRMLRKQTIEMMLASGLILLAKGSIGSDGKATADELIAQARMLVAQLWDQRTYLLANGASGSLSGPSIFAKSNWTQDSDPNFDYSPGVGDREYAQPPAFQDGDDL